MNIVTDVSLHINGYTVSSTKVDVSKHVPNDTMNIIMNVKNASAPIATNVPAHGHALNVNVVSRCTQVHTWVQLFVYDDV